MIDRACEDKLYQTSKIAGAVRYNVPTGCATLLSPRGPSLALRAIHLVSRLRKLTHMCSSTLSVNCVYVAKQTLRQPDCRSFISKRSPVSDLRQVKKQRETGVKRVETAGVYPLARRRGCGEPPPPKVGAHSICAGSSETAVYVLHRPQSCAKIILLWEKHSWSAQTASPRSLTSWSER